MNCSAFPVLHRLHVDDQIKDKIGRVCSKHCD